MSRFVVYYWLALLVLFCAAYGTFKAWQHNRGGADRVVAVNVGSDSAPADSAGSGNADQNNADAPPLAHFTLKASDGQPFDSRRLDGQVWIGSFFFTTCPSSCVKLNQAVAALQNKFPESDLHFVSISCDPASDTPEALASYAKRFKADPARWHFLVGDLGLVKRIGTDIFKLAVERQTHSEKLTLIDREGKVRGRYNALDPQQIALLEHVLAETLREPAKPHDTAATRTDQAVKNDTAQPRDKAEAAQGAAAEPRVAPNVARGGSQTEAAR